MDRTRTLPMYLRKHIICQHCKRWWLHLYIQHSCCNLEAQYAQDHAGMIQLFKTNETMQSNLNSIIQDFKLWSTNWFTAHHTSLRCSKIGSSSFIYGAHPTLHHHHQLNPFLFPCFTKYMPTGKDSWYQTSLTNGCIHPLVLTGLSKQMEVADLKWHVEYKCVETETENVVTNMGIWLSPMIWNAIM